MPDVVCAGTINVPVSAPHITVPRITTPPAKTHVTTPQGNIGGKITGTNSAKTVGKAYSKTVGAPGTGTVGGAKLETVGAPGTGTVGGAKLETVGAPGQDNQPKEEVQFEYGALGIKYNQQQPQGGGGEGTGGTGPLKVDKSFPIFLDKQQSNSPTPKGFEIKDFSFGVENPTTVGSSTGGAGSGKVKFNEFSIGKITDSASPIFLRQETEGSSPTQKGTGGDKDANANAVLLQHIKTENEGFERDTSPTEGTPQINPALAPVPVSR
jgi:type VI protein secretion system component Hcp